MKLSLSMSSVVAAVAVSLYTGVAASPAPASEPAPVEDWKTAVGWDGVVLESSAIGTPAFKDATTNTLEKRTVGGVYICTDIEWKGTCAYAVQPLNECINLAGEWLDSISSFGPDECTTCFAYSDAFCTGNSWRFTAPGDGTGDLGGVDSWNDLIASFECQQSC